MFTAESELLFAGPYLQWFIIITRLGLNCRHSREERVPYKTGTRRTTALAPSAASTDISPSRLVTPYVCSGFVGEDGMYGGALPSKT